MIPALAAAASRLDTLFVDDYAVDNDALAQFELPLPDPRGRADLRAAADRIARLRGRGELLDQADVAELAWAFDRVRGLADNRASVGSLERDATTPHRGLRWLLGAFFVGGTMLSVWAVSLETDPAVAASAVFQGAIGVRVVWRLAAPVGPKPSPWPEA